MVLTHWYKTINTHRWSPPFTFSVSCCNPALSDWQDAYKIAPINPSFYDSSESVWDLQTCKDLYEDVKINDPWLHVTKRTYVGGNSREYQRQIADFLASPYQGRRDYLHPSDHNPGHWASCVQNSRLAAAHFGPDKSWMDHWLSQRYSCH